MSLVDDVQSFNMAVQAMDTEMHALSEEMDAEFERSFVNIRPQAENAQFIAGTNEAQFRDNRFVDLESFVDFRCKFSF